MSVSGRWRFSIFCILLIVALAACGGGEEESGPSELALKLTQEAVAVPAEEEAAPAEEEAEPAPAAEEATPAPVEEEAPAPVEEATPLPEEAAEDVPPTANPELEAAAAAATEAAEAIQLTVEAAQLAEQAADDAVAAEEAPIRAELVALGVDPEQGELGFTHPPISLESVEFESYSFDNQNALTVARDFVIAADITWNSRFAESGCGFVVRSNGDENALDQYIIGLTRGAQGHVLFAEQKKGDVKTKDITDIYANGIDPFFGWQSGDTNRVAVVGRGEQFDIYSNGTYLGTVTGGAGFEEGFVAFFAVNRSGGITCDFNNAYLWKIN